ncbi:hypothetical protein [Paenibacillus sp. MMS20-IR301]|nr:hypothetical protein [Paenibacillus sp. MMS20-IR301]WNS41507.1 hypothetical protein LOS79_21100 [Paenibacillus sp. MMS20-IR301]
MDRISGGWYSALRQGFAIRGYRQQGSRGGIWQGQKDTKAG